MVSADIETRRSGNWCVILYKQCGAQVSFNKLWCRTPIVGRDSSVGIATELRGGRSEDRIPVLTRFSTPVPPGPWVPPSPLYRGGGVKWPGVGVDHPPPASTEVKEWTELHPLLHNCTFMACSSVKLYNIIQGTVDAKIICRCLAYWNVFPDNWLVQRRPTWRSFNYYGSVGDTKHIVTRSYLYFPKKKNKFYLR
jgi:hypothetical protein